MASQLFYFSGMQIFDSNGAPIVGAKIESYEQGGGTPQATYSDSARSSANPNPASGATTGGQVSDANGRFGSMFLENDDYQFIVKDDQGNTLYTVDGVSEGQNDNSVTTGTSVAMIFTSGQNGLVDSHSLGYLPVDRSLTLPSGATGSQAAARIASTASKSFTIKKNGSSVGTVDFATTTVGTFTVASTTAWAAGDTIEVVGPTTADTTLRYVGITLQLTT